MPLLRRCACYNYTIDESKIICEKCNQKYLMASPPKFSLHDKYAEYRRKMKEIARKEGLL